MMPPMSALPIAECPSTLGSPLRNELPGRSASDPTSSTATHRTVVLQRNSR
jgi:hypothetical protein